MVNMNALKLWSIKVNVASFIVLNLRHRSKSGTVNKSPAATRCRAFPGYKNQMSKSKRKPHNDLAGYICELKSHHPKLPGHIVIVDREKGGDWLEAPDRYVVVHMNGDSVGCFVSVPRLPAARLFMKDVAKGGDSLDLGQHD